MTAQTVSVARNLDDAALSALLHGEAITINGGARLTINSDNRWAQQAAVIGSVTIDATQGGELYIDGTEVWWIPFDASTGTVPALPTLGTNDVSVGGTPVGELLGIWATIPGYPLAASIAIPTTGFIKLRRKVATIADNDVLTLSNGATLTVNHAAGGQRGWLDISGVRSGTISIPRRGKLTVRGDNFYIGVTSGATDQTFSVPYLGFLHGVEVETGPGTGIYRIFRNAGNARWFSTTATISTDSRGYFFNQSVSTITATTTVGSAVIPTTATANLVEGMPVVASANFTTSDDLYIVSVNPGVSFTVSANATIAASTTFNVPSNVVTIGRSVAPAVGFVPPAGCNVRIPNINLSTAAAAFTSNCLPTTLTTKYETATTSAGVLDVVKVNCDWYINITTPYSAILEDVYYNKGIVISTAGASIRLTRCVNSFEFSTANSALTLSNCFLGGVIEDCIFTHYGSSTYGTYGTSITDCSGFTVTNTHFVMFGASSSVQTRGNSDVRSMMATRLLDSTFTNCVIGMCKVVFSSCADIVVNNIQYYDTTIGATTSTNPTAAIDITSLSVNVTVNGFAWYGSLANVQPYNALVALSAGNKNITIANIGTPTVPFDFGSANQTANIVTVSVTIGLVLRRLYVSNTRTSPLSLANTVQDVVIDNVKGDYADSQAVNSLNTLCRGCRWTNSVSGQASVYGRHWEDAFTSATAGRILLACNAPTTSTSTQASITAGTPAFTSAGTIAMPTVGDSVEFTMPYSAIGYTAFANSAPTVTGTNTANFLIEFKYDIGGGFSAAWATLSAANLVAVGAIGPAVGVRIKLRATTIVANVTNALTYIRIDMVTTSTEQQREYPLPTDASGVVAGILTNTRIILYNATKATTLYDGIVAATSLTMNYYNDVEVSAGDTIECYHALYGASISMKKGKLVTIATATGYSFLVQQEQCPVYAAYYSTYGITGQQVYDAVEWIKDGVNLQADLDDADGTWFAHRLFMWDKYQTWFNSGNRGFFLKISATDPGTIEVSDLHIDNLNANNYVQGDTIRIHRTDGAYPVINPTTGGGGIDVVWQQPVLQTTTGGVTPSEAQIKSWVLAAEIVPGWSMARAIRKITAMAAAKTSGNTTSGATTVVIRTLDDTADEMSATVDANGNRTAVTQGA